MLDIIDFSGSGISFATSLVLKRHEEPIFSPPVSRFLAGDLLVLLSPIIQLHTPVLFISPQNVFFSLDLLAAGLPTSESFRVTFPASGGSPTFTLLDSFLL